MRKIVECRVIIVWDDDTQEDISYHIPEGIIEPLEDYLDMLEKEKQ
jgi:hypothetical protein